MNEKSKHTEELALTDAASAGKLAQAIENLDAKIFGCRHMFAKFRNLFIQVFTIERFDHCALDECIEVGQVCDHSRGRVHRTRHGDFDDVVVAVPIGIIALAVDTLIRFFVELRAVQSMRGRETVSPRQMEIQFGTTGDTTGDAPRPSLSP